MLTNICSQLQINDLQISKKKKCCTMEMLINDSQISQEKMVTPQKHSLTTHKWAKKKSLHNGCVRSQLTNQLRNIMFELCRCSHVQHSLMMLQGMQFLNGEENKMKSTKYWKCKHCNGDCHVNSFLKGHFRHCFWTPIGHAPIINLGQKWQRTCKNISWNQWGEATCT